MVSYSPDDFNAHAAVLKDGGRASTPLSAAGEGPGRTNVMAIPSPENLERLAQLLDDGVLNVPLQDSYPLDQAGEAMNALAAMHTQGKLGIKVS